MTVVAGGTEWWVHESNNWTQTTSEYQIRECDLHIAPDALLIDTNVFVYAFAQENSGRDGLADYAQYALNDLGRPLLVPVAVVVETLNFLTGKLANHEAGMRFLAWLNAPNRADVVPPFTRDLAVTERTMGRWRLDCVDVMLAEIATDITSRCGLRPAISILTTDTEDFTKMLDERDFRFSIADLRDPYAALITLGIEH